MLRKGRVGLQHVFGQRVNVGAHTVDLGVEGALLLGDLVELYQLVDLIKHAVHTLLTDHLGDYGLGLRGTDA